jgi:hypothetical protein
LAGEFHEMTPIILNRTACVAERGARPRVPDGALLNTNLCYRNSHFPRGNFLFNTKIFHSAIQ